MLSLSCPIVHLSSAYLNIYVKRRTSPCPLAHRSSFTQHGMFVHLLLWRELRRAEYTHAHTYKIHKACQDVFMYAGSAFIRSTHTNKLTLQNVFVWIA